MKSTIEKKLKEKFTTGYILVEDKSSLHVGHIEELKDQKETHIHITIKTKEFYGLEPLARHKIIYEILKDEISMIHAISIDAQDQNSN